MVTSFGAPFRVFAHVKDEPLAEQAATARAFRKLYPETAELQFGPITLANWSYPNGRVTECLKGIGQDHFASRLAVVGSRAAFLMMRTYERAHNTTFNWILSARLDIVMPGMPLAPWCSWHPGYVYTTFGVANLIPASAADAFFSTYTVMMECGEEARRIFPFLISDFMVQFTMIIKKQAFVDLTMTHSVYRPDHDCIMCGFFHLNSHSILFPDPLWLAKCYQATATAGFASCARPQERNYPPLEYTLDYMKWDWVYFNWPVYYKGSPWNLLWETAARHNHTLPFQPTPRPVSHR